MAIYQKNGSKTRSSQKLPYTVKMEQALNKGQRLAPDGSKIPREIDHSQHPPEILDTNS